MKENAQSDLDCKALLENLPEAVVVFAPATGQVVYLNPRARRESGQALSSNQPESHNWIECIPLEDRARFLDAATHFETQAEPVRHRFQRLDGTWRQFEASFFAIGGTSELLGALIRDLTESAEAARLAATWEAERERLMQSLLVSELAALITHEVNQPLTAILSWSEGAHMRMSRMGPLPEGVAILGRAFEAITTQGRRAGEIVNRLRRLIQRVATDPVDVPVSEAVERAVRGFRRTESRAHVDVPTDLETAGNIRGDAAHLEVALVSALRHLHRALSQGTTDVPTLHIVLDASKPELLRLHLPDAPAPGLSLCPMTSAAAARGSLDVDTLPADEPQLDLGVAAAALEMAGGVLLLGVGLRGHHVCLELPRRARPRPASWSERRALS